MKPSPNTDAASHQPNLNELMLARSDWLAQQLLARVKASKFDNITPAQTRLLAQMAGKPTSMAELARRLGVSRQAVHKTVSELERRGILRIDDDPMRGNARKIVYTELGREVNREGAKIIQSIEQQLAQRLGAKQVKQLKALLTTGW
jgi:DNA-binding MarR family transcriptional regulator